MVNKVPAVEIRRWKFLLLPELFFYSIKNEVYEIYFINSEKVHIKIYETSNKQKFELIEKLVQTHFEKEIQRRKKKIDFPEKEFFSGFDE